MPIRFRKVFPALNTRSRALGGPVGTVIIKDPSPPPPSLALFTQTRCQQEHLLSDHLRIELRLETLCIRAMGPDSVEVELSNLIHKGELEITQLKCLTTTNSSLTSVQRKLLCHLIEDGQGAVERVKSKFQEKMAQASHRANLMLQVLEEQTRLYKKLLSPLRELPVEILGQIFELVVYEALRENQAYVGIRVLTLILAPSQVCSRWRNICHCTPRLWKVLPQRFEHVNSRHGEVLRSSGNVDAELDTELISLWLQRGSPHPVEISLRGDTHQSPIPLLPTLNQASRIGVLRLYANDTEFSAVSKDIVQSMSFPLLHTLELTVTSSFRARTDEMDSDDEVEDLPGPPIRSSIEPILPLLEHLNAPQLSRLELRLASNKLPDIHRYGTQLRELDLTFESSTWYVDLDEVTFPTRNVFAVLQHCPQLVKLNLYVNCRAPVDEYTGQLVLNELTTLVVSFGEDFDHIDDTMEVFSSLTLPKLDVLDIHFPDDVEFDGDVMQAFKERSGFSLHRLILRNCDMIEAEDLWEFVEDMETLEELYIGRYHFWFDFLPSLLPSETNGIQRFPLPSLHTFSMLIWIPGMLPTPIIDDVVEPIVKSRWWTDPAQRPCSRWRQFHVARDDYGTPFNDDDEDDDGKVLSPKAQKRMDAIVSEGLSLDFETGDWRPLHVDDPLYEYPDPLD
ncbi:hypothetical protein V5O48_001783 [Marasmius crinis-equi]|uniref:F-box domain-containing protein n=1 Tax=Marasmius crinis-equi TaxID=585013 RepID=A0ABR3FXE5_9AGAR